jgi:hypothetical protein
MADNLSQQQAFLKVWNARYPETPPISHLFKHRLPHRWARIHSLPGSKRYAETEADWACLLHRQNTVIDDLVGPGVSIIVVINAYKEANPLLQSEHVAFVGTYAAGEGEYETACHQYRATWQRARQEPLLRLIAGDEMRAFFIASDCLVAPYDGGLDVILKHQATRDAFRRKYQDWLSERQDGL